MFTRQRYVVVGVIALAALTGLTLDKGLEWIWVYAGLDNPFLLGIRQLQLTTTIAFAVALAAGIAAVKYEPAYVLANEVVEELSKVTWPTREETGNATVVVIVAVFICAAYLGAFDAVWLAITDWILGIEPLVEG